MAENNKIDSLVDDVARKRGLSRQQVQAAIDITAKSLFPTSDVEISMPSAGNGSAPPGMYRYMTAGRGVDIERAREILPEAMEGDLVPVPVDLQDGLKRRFRWMLNKTLSAMETEILYRKWIALKGHAVLGSPMGHKQDGSGDLYVDLGDAVGILEKKRMTPGDKYITGVAMTFLVSAVKLRIETKGRLEILLSRNSKRLADALLNQMVPGVRVTTVKRIAGKRCVVVSMDGKLPGRVVAELSKILGEFVRVRVPPEVKKALRIQKYGSKKQKDAASASR